jgi:hypothetical protein
MRTTLDIADDVLHAAKNLAKHQGTTAGRVISDLARQALGSRAHAARSPARRTARSEFVGFRPFPRRGGLVTDELVNQLRDAQPD